MGWVRSGNKIRFAFPLHFQWIPWKPEKLSLGAGGWWLYSPEKLRPWTRILALRRKRVNSNIHR